jgi:hypothetical protein
MGALVASAWEENRLVRAQGSVLGLLVAAVVAAPEEKEIEQNSAQVSVTTTH